jgi:acyl transferase domain-containing protein
VGEYVAAVLAGVFSLEDALAIIAARAGLMQALPGGSMRAVRLSADELSPYLGDGVDLAALNTPGLSVVSGSDEAVGRFVERMEAAGHETIELHTSHAFHSEMMEPILEPFREAIAGVERHAPRLPIVSTVTGEALSDEEAADPDYWAGQVRRPVRFSDAIMALHQVPHRVYLEVGPGQTLSNAVLQHPAGPDGDARVAVIDSLGHPGKRLPALRVALEALGKLWAAGVPVAPASLYAGERRRRVPLPTYPFERKRHWIDPPPLGGRAPAAALAAAEPLAALSTADAAAATAGETVVASAGAPDPIDAAGLADGLSPHDRIVERLTRIVAERSGLDESTIDTSAPFTELGLDSLLLTEVNAQVRTQLGVRVTLGQLLNEAPSIVALAVLIEPQLDPDLFAPAAGPPPAPGSPPEPAPAVAAQDSGDLDPVSEPRSVAGSNGHRNTTDVVEALIAEQIRIMDQQLDLLRSHADR